MEQKTINVFLASPGELKEDRVSFRSFVSEIDETFLKMRRPLKTRMWEGLDASYKGHPEQDEYDKLIRASHMFLALFHTVGGEFTIHEFNVALEKFNQTKQTPKIYVYMKALQEGEKIDSKLEKFQKRLENKKMRLYWTTYSTQDSLHLHFLQQLLIVYADGLSNLKVEDGTVKLWDMDVAKMSNLSFAADNKDYNQLKKELEKLPNEIEKARKRTEKYPDDEDLRDELQEKLNRYNNKKEEFARLQQALFETSQRIATMQRENLSDKLHHAKEAFESGNLDGANALLDEIVNETELCYKNLKQVHESIYQGIAALLLRAKTKMAEVNIPIKERIEEVHAIYVKADQWAKDSALPDDKLDRLLEDYGNFLYTYGKISESKTIFLRLIALCERLYSSMNPTTAIAYNSIGDVYWRLGKYDDALEYHKKALAIRKSILGSDHPDTVESYNEIGVVYYSMNNYSLALEYYLNALRICEHKLGTNHPYTAGSYNNIGSLYLCKANYLLALDYYKKALNIHYYVLGANHPSTAMSYNNIGRVYEALRDYPAALNYHHKALTIRESIFGLEHPDTAMSYNNIGLTYDNLGDYTKALEYYQKALAIFAKVLGSDHPNTKTVKMNLEYCQLMKAKQDGTTDDER